MFTGSIVALVTPFKKGAVDYEALAELIEFQIRSGTNGILPCGTTGESATLSHEEHDQVVEFVVGKVAGRVPVIAGSGSNCTREALRLTGHAKEAGADGALVITPYYNKPTQRGLQYHYEHLAKEVDIPIVIYNVPGRTGISIAPETVASLAKLPNIVAIKEASGSLEQVSQIISQCDIAVLSGDDSLTFPIMALGGKGVVSVVANILPGPVAEMVSGFSEKDIKGARTLHYELYQMSRILFVETNPIPVKAALAMMGKIKEEYRLPLCQMSDENRSRLERILKDYKLV
ncbi:MAG: 4-hydroxy-tetrahydrodipicolinate synthase [Candidatus Aureabacteria bacterium]|nr:4-hydroxy-tetrahydrodipicolinate synthase [Candidatus Auribacterota bacterium]